MPNSATAELYFIAAMFLLILLICAVSLYVFFRTYNIEKKAKQKRLEQKVEENKRKETVENT
jgi:predicted membrane protein